MSRVIGYGALIVAIILIAVLAARVLAPGAMEGGLSEPLAYRVGWLALLLVALFVGWRQTPGNALKSLLVWAVIILVLVVAYSMRDTFRPITDRVMAELSPGTVTAPPGEPNSGSAASVRRALDGHFWAEGTVNGTRVRFLVDTGASAVVLTRGDARRLGIDFDELRYTQRMMTANGETRGALIRLDEVKIGNVRVTNVAAVVPQNDVLTQSLLGMSFLGQLSRYEATQESLILRQ
ncbi:retropepsin-like aspartic protease family protein [Euryhalocaulis caribicus]|uniref:retropepsin-like aspartic protease family protein n=1 Tax=Euryhalocaulis caribicus TaxID=1161401 RepID=UPI00039F96D8|nr:TIGR02281 family clan AA aspartic protease [Euryhalocaulis caribicus]